MISKSIINLHTALRTGIALCAALFLSAVAHAQCSLHPIALSVTTIANANIGDELGDIWNGSQPGNFGWLSWTGDPGEPTLNDSLSPAGDSNTYINPDVDDDHLLTAGKWVSGKPGVSNSKHVRAALDTLINNGTEITVPVWDQARGQGENTAYHVVAFVRVKLVSYQLPQKNVIRVIFLGYSACGNEPA